MGGYYSGLGQALSLVSMGLDFVYLWHVFEIREDIFAFDSSDGKLDREMIAHHRDILTTYTDQVIEILREYDLPIGYFAHGLVPKYENRLLRIASYPREDIKTSSNDSDTPIRKLLSQTILE